jgi:predicted RNase H-like HicB family nuclease
MKFTLAIHKDKDSSYGVTVPDVSGCFSAGDTLNEAIENSKEAIAAHLEALIELGMPLPLNTQPIEQHMNNEDFKDAIWAIAEVDMSTFDKKPERVNISLPKFILAAVDAYAKKQGQTRSGFLAESALKAMHNN